MSHNRASETQMPFNSLDKHYPADFKSWINGRQTANFSSLLEHTASR
jgi:hypothetical protein